jgi:hypothetical protein
MTERKRRSGDTLVVLPEGPPTQSRYGSAGPGSAPAGAFDECAGGE